MFLSRGFSHGSNNNKILFVTAIVKHVQYDICLLRIWTFLNSVKRSHESMWFSRRAVVACQSSRVMTISMKSVIYQQTWIQISSQAPPPQTFWALERSSRSCGRCAPSIKKIAKSLWKYLHLHNLPNKNSRNTHLEDLPLPTLPLDQSPTGYSLGVWLGSG